jgi:hypothetical protein
MLYVHELDKVSQVSLYYQAGDHKIKHDHILEATLTAFSVSASPPKIAACPAALVVTMYPLTRGKNSG